MCFAPSCVLELCVQDKDLIVNGLKKQIRQMVQYSQQAPQAKLMEPLTNQPVSSFEFAFKIRVSRTQLGVHNSGTGNRQLVLLLRHCIHTSEAGVGSTSSFSCKGLCGQPVLYALLHLTC